MPKREVSEHEDNSMFGPEVDTHQVQRLAEAAHKAAETASAAVSEPGDDEAALVESAVEVQAEALSDSNPEEGDSGKGH